PRAARGAHGRRGRRRPERDPLFERPRRRRARLRARRDPDRRTRAHLRRCRRAGALARSRQRPSSLRKGPSQRRGHRGPSRRPSNDAFASRSCRSVRRRDRGAPGDSRGDRRRLSTVGARGGASMIWLTLREHRAQLIAMSVTAALLAIGLAVMGSYAATLRTALGVDTCVPLPNTNSNCVDLSVEWTRRIGPAPFLIAALFLGPALAASAVGGLVGALSRRALTGMFVGLLLFAGARAVAAFELRPNYQPPLVAYERTDWFANGPPIYPPGAWVLHARDVDGQGRPIDFKEL